MSKKDVVVTSINPSQRLDHQLKCVDRWRQVGYTVLLAQSPKEAEILLQHGLSEEDLHRVDPADTSLTIHGKPIPRIMPLLEHLSSSVDPEHLILVNADIYPGIRSKLTGLHALHPCGALTRMDVLSLDPIAINRATSYRGGLDCFFFDRQTLSKTVTLLSSRPASERMTFGIPGWDFYLAGAILRFIPGAALLDGKDLFHVTHPPSYSDMSELTYYVPDLLSWGTVRAEDPYEASNQFLNSIVERCIRSSENSRVVSTIHRDFSIHMGSRDADSDTKDPAEKAVDVVRRYAQSEGYSAKPVLDFYCQSGSEHVRFAEALECLLIVRHAQAEQKNRKFQFGYPDSSLHKEAILNALRLGAPHLVRNRIIELFVSDLTEHNICNRRLLGYLALSCTNDRERALVVQLLESVKLEANAKAA